MMGKAAFLFLGRGSQHPGPGKVLSGLVKKIAPKAPTYIFEGIQGIEALASEVSGATM